MCLVILDQELLCMWNSLFEKMSILQNRNTSEEDQNLLMSVAWGIRLLEFSSVQLISHVWLFATPWTATRQASLSITNCQSLLKLMFIRMVMPPNHLILSSPSPPAFNLSQHQGLFQWVSSSLQMAKVLEFQHKHQSFQWIQDWFPLGWTVWISLQSKGLSRVFSNTIVQKHQFFSAQLL